MRRVLHRLPMSRIHRVLARADVDVEAPHKALRCLTHAQLRQLYLLTHAKSRLLRLEGNVEQANEAKEEEVAQWSVEQTAQQLSRRDLYADALRLLHAFDCDCAPVFDHMAQALLFADADAETETESASEAESERSWAALQGLLEDYDGVERHFRYTLGVVRTLLSFEARVAVPALVLAKLETLRQADLDVLLVPLLELLCQHGKILDSLRLFSQFALSASSPRVSIEGGLYNYQRHALWKVAHKLFAYCSTLQLHHERRTLMASLAHWIARPGTATDI